MAEESSRRRLSGNGAARGYGQNCAARYSEPVAAAGMDEVPVLRALLEISQAVQRAQYFDEALEVIAEQALLALDAASLSISRWERPDNVLRTLVNVGDLGPGEERWPENELYPVTDDQHVVELLQHGRPYISSIDDENVDPAALAVLRRVNKESELAVAVMFDDTMWGELWATGAGGRRFGLDDIQLLQAIAAHVAVAIGRTELFSMVWRYAFEDPLTGLANRRKIDEWTVLDEGGRSRPAVLVCDVDGLKEVNDRRGHPAGDAVLRDVATVLTGIASATTGSLVARLGGDEFCIVLPHSTLSDAERFARDAGRLLRRDTAESVSLSWGAAGFGPQTRSGQQLIAAADAALIEAKRLGPGRFSVGVAETQGMPGSSGRRSATSTSDVTPPAKDDLVSRVVRLLDEHPPKTTAAALEILAVQVCSAIDAAAWCISVTIEDGTAVRTLRGIDSTHDGTSGLRVLATAGNTVYSLAEYPATAGAIVQGDAFTAAVDFADSDPAEVALLTELGYRAVLGVGVPDAGTQYLLELYWDGSHADLSAIAPHVRVLAQYCTTAARRP